MSSDRDVPAQGFGTRAIASATRPPVVRQGGNSVPIYQSVTFEAEDAAERLRLVTALLRAELRAMNVIPSLPATEVARTRWSPN